MPDHLTLRDRLAIAHLHGRNLLQKRIAAAINSSPSTISRELRRNCSRHAPRAVRPLASERHGASRRPARCNAMSGEYLALPAQHRSERRRRERPLSRKMTHPAVDSFVRTGLSLDWSPAQIAGRMKQQGHRHRVCAQTIYTWIDRHPDRDHWRSLLRRRQRRPWYNRRARRRWPGARIRGRPAVIERRERLGDFEADTILGPAGTGGLLTLVCRRSRWTIIARVASKNADYVFATLISRLSTLPPRRLHSITFDNGGEFALCRRLTAALGISVYFADPGKPYQRGTSENTNGLIRYYFPDKTNFRDVSHSVIRHVTELLNSRPRACLGFRSPQEVFFEWRVLPGCT